MVSVRASPGGYFQKSWVCGLLLRIPTHIVIVPSGLGQHLRTDLKRFVCFSVRVFFLFYDHSNVT